MTAAIYYPQGRHEEPSIQIDGLDLDDIAHRYIRENHPHCIGKHWTRHDYMYALRVDVEDVSFIVRPMARRVAS